MGRIVRINGFLTVAAAQQELRGLLRTPHGTRQIPAVHLLARVAQTTPEEYLEQHSLHYLGRAILQRESPREKELAIHIRSLRPLRGAAYLCEACVRADIQQFGMSYWHVDHQLPGNFWCALHHSPLRYVPDIRTFLARPSIALGTSRQVDPRWLATLKGQEAIDRFVSVQRAFLQQVSPLDSASVGRGLMQLATARGLTSERGANYTPFSDYLIDHLDLPWIRTVLPTFRVKQRGQWLRQVDQSLARGHAGGTAYMLMYSLMHDSAQSAIEAIRSAAELRLSKPSLKRTLEVVDLRHVYARAEGNYSEAARLLHMPVADVGRRLHAIGLPSLSNQNSIAQIRLAIERFVGQGISIREACKGLQVTVIDLEEILRYTARNIHLALRTRSSASRVRTQPPHVSR